MNPHPPRIFVIMVHYGDPTVTQQSLAALAGGRRQPDRVIVVDHAEAPFTLPPRTGQQVVRPAANAGYAAGLNVGLGVIFTHRPAERDIVVCMNNDTEVGPDSLQRLEAHLVTAGPVLVGARWGGVNLLTGRSRLLPNSVQRPRPAGAYVDGAFFAAPWSVFYQLKKLPDQYFMYWEESLLASRLRELGLKQQVLPDVGIRHADVMAAPSNWRTYYLVRNGAHYLQTFTPWPARGWWKIYNRLRWVYHRGRGTQSGLVARALADALREKLGKGNIGL